MLLELLEVELLLLVVELLVEVESDFDSDFDSDFAAAVLLGSEFLLEERLSVR